jgi:hypothetical protein
MRTWKRLQGKQKPTTHDGKSVSSWISYFEATSCLIFAELRANQQNPPRGPKILIGVDIRQQRHPSFPISQQQVFFSLEYLKDG